MGKASSLPFVFNVGNRRLLSANFLLSIMNSLVPFENKSKEGSVSNALGAHFKISSSSKC